MWRVDQHAVHVEDRAGEPAVATSAVTARPAPRPARTSTVASAQLADLLADADPDRAVGALGVDRHIQPAVGEAEANRRPTELHGEREVLEAIGQPRREAEDVAADRGAEVPALYQVERAGHHPHVDALLGGAALDVADVALERHEEALPRALGVDPGQRGGVGDEAERRAVRGAGVVVLDVLASRVRGEVVPEPLEELGQLLLGEQEEEHDRIGLLGQLVAVRIVALGPKDPVEALDPAVVALAVPVPIEVRELPVSLELADDALAVERHQHLAAHVPPRGDLVVGQPEPGPQRPGAARRQQVENLRRGGADPRDHDVGVGVVPKAPLLRPRVLLVELVGPHHPMDLIAIAFGVVMRERGPEAGDLQHHLRPVVEHELGVAGRLVVVPDVVEDRGVHMALVVAEVPLPASRERVEVDDLGLLLAVAAALPRVHRAAVAGRPRRPAGLPEPARPVLEQVPADARQAEVEEREHVHLVPEDVTPVGLAVQAARDDTRIMLG